MTIAIQSTTTHVIDAKPILEMEGRYEDKYGHYMELFKVLAESPEPITVMNVPHSWAPFIEYMGHEANMVTRVNHFPCDPIAYGAWMAYPRAEKEAKSFLDKRQIIETISTLRPELVDALWKYDMQWNSVNRAKQPRAIAGYEILITNNGSYHRPEIIEYFDKLKAYTPTKKNVVLVPCAADKPYPAPMHSAVISRMPESFYLANITGVLGVVPQDLWPIMPMYDSGIPNEWRLVNVAAEYFARVKHDRIVVYIDFYSLSLKTAFERAGVDMSTVTWVNPCEFYYDYLDLQDQHRLNMLAVAMNAPEAQA